MKKKFKFNELSNQVCASPGCNTKIKKRLTNKKNPNQFCYKCWAELEAGRNHFIGHLGQGVTPKPEPTLPM